MSMNMLEEVDNQSYERHFLHVDHHCAGVFRVPVFRLRFSYERPGMNHCDYTPESGWECYRYY